MNYLFVCRMNMNRSPYVAEWAERYCRSQGIGAEIRSAGLGVKNMKRRWPGLSQVDCERVDWADKIFIMEAWMAESLKADYGADTGRIYNLDIPDNFARNEQDSTIPADITENEISTFLGRGNSFGPYLMDRVLEKRLAPHLRA